MRLLLLDNAIDHEMYRPLDQWALLAGFTPDCVHVAGGAPLPPPGAHSHVIISGSEDTITALAPWAEAEAEWLRQAVTAGAHVLGSCWGHQLIAAALGGPGCVRHASTPEFGWEHITVADDGGLLPPAFDAFVSHFDEVIPGSHPDLVVLASSPGCAVQALRWRDLPVWGIQAHPEVEPEIGRAFFAVALERWPDHAELFHRALAAPVRDTDHGRTILQRFLAT
jgi:GMP synthase-like glutamine amidotransferase